MQRPQTVHVRAEDRSMKLLDSYTTWWYESLYIVIQTELCGAGRFIDSPNNLK